MPGPSGRSDGYTRGWHPDQRVGMPAGIAVKKCSHPAEHREVLLDSNGDKIEHCQLCDDAWWVFAK